MGEAWLPSTHHREEFYGYQMAFTEHHVARQEGGRVYCYQAGKGDPLVF